MWHCDKWTSIKIIDMGVETFDSFNFTINIKLWMGEMSDEIADDNTQNM